MLNDIGIHDIRITNENDDYSLEFMVKLKHNEFARKVRINIPFTTELRDTIRKKEQRKRVLFRILFYHLKDKFVAISNGLKEFEEEFLSDLVVIADGKERRLGDIIVPQYKHQLKTNKIAILNITN